MPQGPPIHHKLEIGLDAAGKYVVADPAQLNVRVLDTCEIIFKGGNGRVVFAPWPFEDQFSTMGAPLRFMKVGDFQFYCYLTPTGKNKEVGYSETAGGGNGNVEP